MEIVLQKITINSFKGIDQSKAVVLDLGKAYSKGKNIAVFKSDQETGKSSTMEGIRYMLAENIGKNPAWSKDQIINNTDDTINIQGELMIDGVEHRIRVTKDKFTFERMLSDLKKFNSLDEPKATLQKLIGPLGVSPMFLKERRGDQQIAWFRETFSGDPEAEKKEQSLKNTLKKATDARRDANRDYTNVKKALEGNDLYQDWETNQERFKEEVTIDKVKERFEAAKKTMVEYERVVNAIPVYDRKVMDAKELIQNLEQQLFRAKAELTKLEDGKVEAQNFIAEHATDKLEYEEAEKEYLNVSKTLAEQQQWKKVVEDKKIMDQFETMVQELDTKKDKLSADLMKLTKKYLPEIEGLEIKIAKGSEDDEGIYYRGKTIAQLSESELWGLYLEICLLKGIRFIFIENVSDLGSKAVDVINKLAKEGVKVFASMMDRKVKEFRYTMTDEI